VAVVNREAGSVSTRLYDREQFPTPFVWRMLGEGTYVVVSSRAPTVRPAGSMLGQRGSDRAGGGERSVLTTSSSVPSRAKTR
jgi:hypothetical protein